MPQTQNFHRKSSAENTKDMAHSHLAVKAKELAFSYPGSSAPVISIPSWEVSEGERLFLQGASGSGKSTLLQLMCGLQVVGSGNLSLAGTELKTLSTAQRDRFRAQTIGMVFQNFNLIPYLSSLDNILLAASLSGRKTKTTRDLARRFLTDVGLDEKFWQQRAHTLSIGQQQRVAIARALINSPEILLFDEPTSALDEENRDLFMQVLIHYIEAHPKTTVIFVSHDARLASYFDRLVALSDISGTGDRERSASKNVL